MDNKGSDTPVVIVMARGESGGEISISTRSGDSARKKYKLAKECGVGTRREGGWREGL